MGGGRSAVSVIFSKEGGTVAFYLLCNVASVVGCVAFNKILYKPPHNFKYASSLMCFHFLCTWMFVVMVKKMGWFTSKKIEQSNYVKLGAAQTGSVGFVNLSLLYNSVGMYQVLKFSNILVTCFIEFIWKGKRYSIGIYLSLLALVLGVTTATVTSLEMTTTGLLMGCLGSLSTAIYQILNKSIQVDQDVKALQLLEYEQPYTAMWAGLFALMTEDVKGLLSYEYNTTNIALMLCSGFFAFGVNVTCYLIIGKTSPVTYGVIGHTKTVFILLFGIFGMGERPTPQSAVGMLMAFFAIVAYTHISTMPTVSSSPASVVAEGKDSGVIGSPTESIPPLTTEEQDDISVLLGNPHHMKTSSLGGSGKKE